MTERSQERDPAGHRPIRVVTAASLFDGHDAAINIMRRLLQSLGAEVIHLGHDRSVEELVEAAVEESADAVAVIVERGRLLARMQQLNREFWSRFEATRSGETPMNELAEWSRENALSPLATIFDYFSREYWPLYQQRRGEIERESLLLGILRRGVDRVQSDSLGRQERGLGWLATLSAV